MGSKDKSIRTNVLLGEAFAPARTLPARCLRLADVAEPARARDVHRTRVACRRLRARLRCFRPILPAGDVAVLRGELRRLAKSLSPVRDMDVMMLRMEGILEQLPEREQLLAGPIAQSMQRERDAALKRARATLTDPQIALSIAQLGDWSHGAVGSCKPGDAKKVLLPLVRKRWRRLAREVSALGKEPPDAALHHVRRTAKNVRYAVEAVAPMRPRRAARLIKCLTALQDSLGTHQDGVVLRQWLTNRVERSDGPTAFVAGQIVGADVGGAQTKQPDWRKAWRAAADERCVSWLSPD